MPGSVLSSTAALVKWDVDDPAPARYGVRGPPATIVPVPPERSAAGSQCHERWPELPLRQCTAFSVKGTRQRRIPSSTSFPNRLGTRSTFPPGVVCDACNNYFASSIEQVVLESGAFKTARFQMLIPNKRKRMPTVEGMLLPLQPGMTPAGQTVSFGRRVPRHRRQLHVIPLRRSG
jgi:hypothetical protein